MALRLPRLAAALLLTAAGLVATGGAAEAADAPVDLVRPFVGTQNFGNTFPGASAPFGMVQVSPDTGGQGGYDYQQNSIYGFSQTHLSGVGCGVAGELPIMPTTGAVSSVDPNDVPVGRTRTTTRRPSPGYYRVGLSKYGVERRADRDRAHRLAALHVPGHRRGQRPVQHRQGQPERLRLRDPRRRRPYGRGPGARRQLLRRQGRPHRLLHRQLRPARSPPTAPGAAPPAPPAAGTRPAPAATAPGSPSTRPPTATSWSRWGCPTPGLDGARKNLTAETGGSLRLRRDPGRAARDLGRSSSTPCKIGGGHGRPAAAPSTPRSTTRCCTRTWPATSTAGTWASTDKVHTAERLHAVPELLAVGHLPPAEPAAGDARPRRSPGTWRCRCVAIGRDGGWLPRWALANSETNIMTGDPVTPFLVEAWSKGLLAGSRAGGVRAAAGERAGAATGRLAVQRAQRDTDYYSRPRLHPVRADAAARTARTRAATTTATTRPRPPWSTRRRTRRWR